MSNDNTRDGAEPSPASAGSQPVAWAVYVPNPAIPPLLYHARPSLDWEPKEMSPLYRSPSLATEERLAVEWAATVAREQSQVALHKTLRSLLERLG